MQDGVDEEEEVGVALNDVVVAAAGLTDLSAEVTAKDSGNYSCAPDNARPAIINLHVIKGKKENVTEKVGTY